MTSQGPSGAPAPPQLHAEPSARSIPTFVGRQPQRSWLAEHLRGARQGSPRLVLLSGEAGAGKTRLIEELEPAAREAGVYICRGRACEDLALPFLPFVEVLRDQLEDIPEVVERALGEDAERLRAVARNEASLPAEDDPSLLAGLRHQRMGLFLAISRFTIELARIRPTLLILDDLHWADGPTIEQLLHLAFAVSDECLREPVPLLVIAAHRPPQPGDRLDRAVERCRRESICHTLGLSELSEAEVRELVVNLGVSKPAHQLVHAIYRVTGGNPLFVQESVDLLRKQGALRERGGYQAAAAALDDLALPTDLLGVIAARARRADETCRKALCIAACLGGRFSPAKLARVGDLDDEALRKALEQGVQHDLLVHDGELLEFRHPLIRNVFYTMSSGDRRHAIHRRIADRLRARSEEEDRDDSLEIAHHLVRAGPEVDPHTLLEHLQPAAERAFARLAWQEAAHFFEAAAEAAASLPGVPDPEIADLHFRAGLAHYRNMDVGPCLEHFERAIERYRQCGDVRGLARVLAERTRAQLTLAAIPFGTLLDVRPLEEVLEALGEDEPQLRGRIMAMLGEAYWHAKDPERAEEASRRALDIGRKIDDDRLCAQAAGVSLALSLMHRLWMQEALEKLREALMYARRSGDPWVQGWPLQRMPMVLAALGRLDEADRFAQEACEVTRATRDFGELSLALSMLVLTAVARGDFELAEEYAQQCMAMAHRSHYPFGGVMALPAVASAHAARGHRSAARRALDLLTNPGSVFEQSGPLIQLVAGVYRQLVLARSGQLDPKEPLSIAGITWAPDAKPSLYRLGLLCAGVETAEAIGDTELGAKCYERLVEADERGILISNGWVFLIPRVLGVAAAQQGWWERAEKHFDRAVREAARVGARPEMGRSLLGYARMLMARGSEDDRGRAGQLLRRAGPILDRLDMQPDLEAAEHLAAQLQFRLPRGERDGLGAAQAENSGSVTLLVSDLEAFTELVERLGDERGQSVIQTHNMILRACLRAHRGREIQHTGDGIMAAFSSPAGALRCAIDVQRDLRRYNARRPELQLRVRMGLNSGRPRTEEDRLFGRAVNAAARICACADPEQILVSDDVRRQLPEGEFMLRDRGPAVLKGFLRPFRLHEVCWTE